MIIRLRKYCLFVLSLAVVCYATASYSQEQYRSEISALYWHYDEIDGVKFYRTGAVAEIFLRPVRTDEHPYAEAAFLEKAGSVIITAVQSNLKSAYSEGGVTASSDWDSNAYSVALNYTTPDFPFVINALWHVSKSEGNYSSSVMGSWNSESDGDMYSLMIGKYLLQNMLVSLRYAYSITESSTSIVPTSFTSSRDNSYLMSAKYVIKKGAGTAVNIQADAMHSTTDLTNETERDTMIRVAGDYYFSRRLSAGIGIMTNNTEGYYDGKTYSANIGMFVTPSLSLQGGYDRFESDQKESPHRWNYTISIAARI